MSLENVDFQTLLHQQVSQIIQGWQQQAVPQENAQELANQLFNMGMIAAQQMIQAPQVQIENAPGPVDITEQMAERITVIFVQGLSSAYFLWYQMGIPQEEGMEIIQNTALYVFEQSKQMTVAALSVPESSDNFNEPQMIQWLSQTSTEAFQFYLTELEKQRGPIPRSEPLFLTEDDGQPQQHHHPQAEIPEEVQPMVEPEMHDVPHAPIKQEAPPVQQKTGTELTKELYSIIATALAVSTLPEEQKQVVLRAYTAEQKVELAKYQDANQIPNDIDFKQLSQQVKNTKAAINKELSRLPKTASYFREKINQLVVKAPHVQLPFLFQSDRVKIKSYLAQFEINSVGSVQPPVLSPGLMQCILDYLQKHVA